MQGGHVENCYESEGQMLTECVEPYADREDN